MRARHAKLREALEQIADPPPPRCRQSYDAASARLWCGECCAYDDDPRYGKDCQPQRPTVAARAALDADNEAA